MSTTAVGSQVVDTRAAWKIVLSVVVVVGAVSSLVFFSSMEGAEYYKHVDEVVANPGPWKGKTLRVQGFVVPGSIEQGKADHALDFRFRIETKPPQKPGEISATYHGLVPDTFKSGSAVVLTGKLTDDGKIAVAPDGVSAKCPSKYDEAKMNLSAAPAAARP